MTFWSLIVSRAVSFGITRSGIVFSTPSVIITPMALPAALPQRKYLDLLPQWHSLINWNSLSYYSQWNKYPDPGPTETLPLCLGIWTNGGKRKQQHCKQEHAVSAELCRPGMILYRHSCRYPF